MKNFTPEDIRSLNKMKEVKPTILAKEIIKDNIDDAVGKLCKVLFECKRNTSEFKTLKKSLLAELKNNKASFFTGDDRAYQIGATGQSILYNVPENKKGHLKSLRGKFIRIICIGSGFRRERELAAHVLRSPKK